MRAIILGAVLMLSSLAWAAEDPLQRAAVPADGQMNLVDYGYRNWGPELVQYRVDTAKFKPGALVLTDPAGQVVPLQIDGGVLSFVARLPRGSAGAYELQQSATDRSKEGTTLAAVVQGDALEVRNEFLAVRMPAPGKKTYEPAAEASTVPAPIRQWAVGGGEWIGGAHFQTARKVASYAFSIVRQGPAVVEYEARYNFVPRGEYVWRLRLSPGMPLAIVTEEFDVGEITDGGDLLMLDLHRGWQPQNVGWVPGSGEQQMPVLETRAYDAAYLDAKRQAQGQAAPVGGVGEAPAPYLPEPGLFLLDKIAPAGRWGGLKGGVQVEDGRSVGLIPLYAGSWRRAMALNVWYQDQVGMTVGLPLSVRYSRWSLEVTDDHSPFSSHEHDPGLSPTYGRREWGLYVGAKPAEAQAQYGYIGLDRYKDWVVDYPEDEAQAKYPGAFFSPQQVEKLKGALDQHPDADFLRTWYLISGRTEDAVAHAQRVINGLKQPAGENNFYLVGLSNYRKSQFFAFVCLAEDALACPDLPADLRQELRRRLALYAHVFSDPDLNPRGAGVHLGNNNMTINRTLALTYFAGLLPDHPRYAYWMECARDFEQYKYGTEMAVDGPNIECPSYALYSPFRTENITQNILRNRGIHDFGPALYHARFVQYLSNLSMADARWDGMRIIPGMGNSSNQFENFWGFSMAAQVDRDPEFAGWLRFMNRLGNRATSLEPGPNGHDNVQSTPHAMYYLPYVPENPQALTTTFMPTYGVAFRNHFNTPNETAMLLRAGMNWGHWDTDALNVILYGKGAPLSPGTEYQYFSEDGPWSNDGVYHNQVKVGARDTQEVFGRVDDAVSDYGFGPHADYAVADRYYPSQVFKDGLGAMWWKRHVLFLKSDRPDGPDYFVLRDTFPGGEKRPTWWNWMNLETPDRILVDGQAFPNAGPLNQTVPEEQMPTQTGQTVEMRTDYGASTWMWFAEPRTVRIRMIAEYTRQDGKGGRQQKTVVEIPGVPGQDYFYAVYPRQDGEAPPACRLLAPGVMEVQTAEATDTVFVGDSAFSYNQGDLVFSGQAGAVRVYPDRVVLCMNAGNGRVGYKGHIIEGPAPFEVVVALKDLKPGVQKRLGGVKEKLTVDLGQGVQVSGEGPFTATLEGQTIKISTSGRARVLQVTQPPFIVRPEYRIDGQQWMANWTDYPASGWGAYDRTWLIGLSVPAGDHELVVRDLQFPPVWTRPFTPLLEGVVVEK